VGVAGLALWILTNWHLVRTGKAIKADIDAKRAGTEAFVEDQLLDLRTSLQEELGKVSAEGLEDRVEARMDVFKTYLAEELQGLESRLATVQIDAGPIMERVQADLIPAVQERVENLKSVLLGKMGYAVKGVKALGEGVAELAGERALEEAGIDVEWQRRLQQYGLDEEWLKTHKTAAFGLSLIKEALGRGENVQIVGNVPPGARRVTPPRGFG